MKKLIFDVDGTILDSMHIWIEPQNRLFSKYGFTLEDLKKEEKGKIEALSVEAMCQYIVDEIAKDMTFDQVRQYFEDVIYDAYKDNLMPKPGNLEILKKLKDLGFSMSVASSTPYTYLEMALKRLGIYDYFDFFATPELLDMKKSDPAFWQYSITKHGAKPSDCVLFDDALYAIKAAKKEGIMTVGLEDFPWNEKEWEYIKEKADLTLPTIADMDINNFM
ncbi:HAD family hydrolase [Anaerococcus degeneri]|uniref:HAD family phosphatase n=1 Tax=Anaerococcus degeneri TaxID=361500 RepID=A0ABS7YXF8_9FIRM|nr:HAD family phosphatase [Anaerococcus degeneri]MBP2016099.1 HAD superfamily hydrolase (TIGR01509 family) [Anaerococcus degeneri]MCA2096426.1 HAD family phosphatase [Anaerococcus degeneri]